MVCPFAPTLRLTLMAGLIGIAKGTTYSMWPNCHHPIKCTCVSCPRAPSQFVSLLRPRSRFHCINRGHCGTIHLLPRSHYYVVMVLSHTISNIDGNTIRWTHWPRTMCMWLESCTQQRRNRKPELRLCSTLLNIAETSQTWQKNTNILYMYLVLLRIHFWGSVL